MSPENVLEILRAAKPELSRFRAKELGLFGSYARAEPSETSDVDVLVDFDDDADLVDFVGLAQFLEERLDRKVDLVPRRALRPELRAVILREVVPL
jgi:predicted nucleotidyltransferase